MNKVAQQLDRLNTLIRALETNQFYARKLRDAGIADGVESFDQFNSTLSFTTKQDLVADQCAFPPYGTNLTYDVSEYTRFNQTSATTGAPLRWLDTPDSWQWMLDNWSRVYDAAGVLPGDRLLFAFSFGPFLGFWTAFESAVRRGCFCAPGGGMSTMARLQAMLDNDIMTLCCTPTYAIRLGQAARDQGIDFAASSLVRIIVAGEPGGSMPATRGQIESLFPRVRVCDHHGMTEVGPVSYQLPNEPTILHVIDDAYFVQVIDPRTCENIAPGAEGEMVLTTLGRAACPLLRYRTGDLVRVRPSHDDADGDTALDGGILGRVDDMVVVRGVNLYPAGVDDVVRRHAGVAEYRVDVFKQRAMTNVCVVVEPDDACDTTELCHKVRAALRDAFNLNIEVKSAEHGALPRFEMKAKRWVRHD